MPNKDSVFVLDFMNDPDAIQAAFEDYYQTTILANETDPDKLHDLRGAPWTNARSTPGSRWTSS